MACWRPLCEATQRLSKSTGAVLEQYLADDRILEFSRDQNAYNLAVASGNAEMVDIVAGYVPHRDEAVTSDGLEQAAEVGDLGMAKVL